CYIRCAILNPRAWVAPATWLSGKPNPGVRFVDVRREPGILGRPVRGGPPEIRRDGDRLPGSVRAVPPARGHLLRGGLLSRAAADLHGQDVRVHRQRDRLGPGGPNGDPGVPPAARGEGRTVLQRGLREVRVRPTVRRGVPY